MLTFENELDCRNTARQNARGTDDILDAESFESLYEHLYKRYLKLLSASKGMVNCPKCNFTASRLAWDTEGYCPSCGWFSTGNEVSQEELVIADDHVEKVLVQSRLDSSDNMGRWRIYIETLYMSYFNMIDKPAIVHSMIVQDRIKLKIEDLVNKRIIRPVFK